MRLIDADAVTEEINRNKLMAREPATVKCMEIIKNATTYIPPKSYDVYAVVGQLEEMHETSNGIRESGKQIDILSLLPEKDEDGYFPDEYSDG